MRNYVFALVVALVAPSVARAEFVIGRDLADAQSGASLDLVEGTTETLEIWVIGDLDQNIRAVAFNWESDAAGIVDSSNLAIDDLTARWPLNNIGANFGDRTADSATGLLINDAQLATLGGFSGTGVTFTAADPAVRLGTIDVTASTIGTANTVFSPGPNGALDQNGSIDGFVVGNRTFNVITAIPEPSSVLAIGLMATLGVVRRGRRRS